MSHGDEDGRDRQRRRGPALRRRPAVARGAGARSTRTTRGWATPRCCSSAARVTSTDGSPLPDAVIDIWQTGPTAATTSGTSASRSSTSAGAEGRRRGRRLRVPDDAAQALHGADRRADRPLPRGGRPAPVAAGAHPLQGDAPGPRSRSSRRSSSPTTRTWRTTRSARSSRRWCGPVERARATTWSAPFDIVLRAGGLSRVRELRRSASAGSRRWSTATSCGRWRRSRSSARPRRRELLADPPRDRRGASRSPT